MQALKKQMRIRIKAEFTNNILNKLFK